MSSEPSLHEQQTKLWQCHYFEVLTCFSSCIKNFQNERVEPWCLLREAWLKNDMIRLLTSSKNQLWSKQFTPTEASEPPSPYGVTGFKGGWCPPSMRTAVWTAQVPFIIAIRVCIATHIDIVCVCLCVLCTYCKVMSNSCATPWTAAHQTPLSMESSRQEYWSGLPFPSPGDLPDPGIKPGWPALQILYCSLWEILDINKKPMHQKAWNYWPLAFVCRMQIKLSIYKWQPTNKKVKTKKQKA